MGPDMRYNKPADDFGENGMVRLLARVVVIVAALIAPAGAAEWPVKPVRIVVPYAAGGAADTLGRLFADVLSTAFGKPFYVENKAAAATIIGSDAVARSPPDGYTFAPADVSTHLLAPAMKRNVDL